MQRLLKPRIFLQMINMHLDVMVKSNRANYFLFLLIWSFFCGCQQKNGPDSGSENGAKDDESLKRIILNVKGDDNKKVFSFEIGYPESWSANLKSENLVYVSQRSDIVTDKYVNNFQASFYSDSLNADSENYNVNFLLNEQKRFPKIQFQSLQSQVIELKNGMAFSSNQIKIWGNQQDTLFSISALTKIRGLVLHLNFYSNYGDKQEIEVIAKKIIRSIKIIE